MKTLSLIEPWATLICCGAKSIETRSWYTSHRGRIAIHASKGLPGDAADMVRMSDLVREAFQRAGIDPRTGRPTAPAGVAWRDEFVAMFRFAPTSAVMMQTRGCVIATANLIGCVRTETLREKVNVLEGAFGDFSAGRYAWLLGDVRPLPEPIPAKGSLGLWDWDETARMDRSEAA